MQLRSQSSSLKTKELRLNYKQGRIKKYICRAKNREDIVKIALSLGDNLDMGIYGTSSKQWVKARTE